MMACVCRRGAAFGLAGVVKGLGLMAMKNCGIMDALKAAVEDKKDAASREVSAFASICINFLYATIQFSLWHHGCTTGSCGRQEGRGLV